MPDDLLPPNATSQERAISLAVDRLPDVPIRTLWSPATCPEAHLPWLAWALSVDEWDSAWPVETKRSAIAESIEIHRKKGTVGALRRALQRLGYEVEIDENTGVAYTFRLRFRVREGETAGGAVSDAAVTRAVDIALRQKNARSELLETSYLSETDPATLYNGGVTINGAEVEIGGGGVVLPLDDYRLNCIGSYWTVRMHSTYKGPIGRVRRASDSAELDYYSTAELNAFVNGTTFAFLKLYSQRPGSQLVSESLDFPLAGEIDSNGFPCVGPSYNFMAVNTNRFVVSQATIIFAGQHLLGDSGVILTESELNPKYALECKWLYGSAVATPLENNSAFPAGEVFTVFSPPEGSHCNIVQFNQLATSVTDATQTDSDTSQFTAMSIDSIRVRPRQQRLYGFAVYSRDLGDISAGEIITAIENHLQF